MKYLVIWTIALVTLNCFAQDKDLWTKKSQLTFDSTPQFEHFEDVQVKQWFEKDSTHSTIAYSEKKDQMGNTLASYTSNYWLNHRSYRDELLCVSELDMLHRDSIETCYSKEYKRVNVDKTFFYYEDSLLVRVEMFRYAPNCKGCIRKGWFNHNRMFFTYSPKKSKWAIDALVSYSFDEKGRRIQRDSYNPTRETHTVKTIYNELGKIADESFYQDSTYVNSKHYTYKSGYLISVKGNSEQKLEEDIEISRTQIDGKLKEITQFNDYSIYNLYDKDKRLIRSECRRDGSTVVVHTYQYK